MPIRHQHPRRCNLRKHAANPGSVSCEDLRSPPRRKAETNQSAIWNLIAAHGSPVWVNAQGCGMGPVSRSLSSLSAKTFTCRTPARRPDSLPSSLSIYTVARRAPPGSGRGRRTEDLMETSGVGLACDAFDARIVRKLVSPCTSSKFAQVPNARNFDVEAVLEVRGEIRSS